MATQIGVITAVVGTVTATAEDGSIRTLQAGDRVYANEVISTGPAGAVEIEFADGSVMDLGRDSQAMLDSAVFDPEATEVAETQDSVPDDVAAIQQAILEGEDPTEAGEATAAGAGVAGGNEGHDAVFVDYLNPEVTPDAGFETIGVNSTFDEIEDEQLLEGVPTAGLTAVLLDEDDLVTEGNIDLTGISAEFLAYLNAEHGVDAFGFDSPAGVSDERTELGDDTGSPDGYFMGGNLVANFGLDGPSETDPIVFNVTSGSDVTDSTGNPVTSQGQQVKYWVSADGLTVIGYIVDSNNGGGQEPPPELAAQQEFFDGCQGSGDDMPEMAEIIFTAQLTPNAEGGSFLVGIYGQFDHAAPDYENGEFVFENNLFLNLGFTVTDGDGDSASGTLQINVDDDSPVRAGDEEQGLATHSGTVYEDSLSFEDGDLSEGNPNSVAAMTITSDDSDSNQSEIESFLGLSAGALEPAVDSNGGAGNGTNGSAAKTTLSVEAGDIISFNWIFNNGETPAESANYNDFAFVVINGEVIELADSSAGNLASNPFTYEVTADGEITIGFGQMNVGDTGVDSSLSVSDLTLNGNPINGGFDGALTGWDTLGNVSDADSVFDSDVASGNLNSLVDMGADGPGSFALLQPSENEAEQALFQAAIDSLPTLSSKGEAVSYSVNNYGDESVLVATAGEGEAAREVFTLTINSDGSWTFDLNDQLDHVEGETAEENFSLITLDENGEPNGFVDSIDFTQLLQIRDFDGDQLIITEDDAGMFTISIKDDIPVATTESVSFTVDEDDINTVLSDGNQPNDSNDDGSFTGNPLNPFDNGPANVTGSVASLVSFGADEVGTFTLSENLDALLAQNLTSQGDELSFSVDGNVLTAEADGREIFSLTLETNGDFTFELNDQLDHAEADGENNLPLDLSSLIVATDADGDAITLESGFVINVTDDVPEQDDILPDIGIVEEEALSNGNQEENDGSIFGFPIDGWPDTAVASGSLADQVSVGADENVTFSLSDDFSSLIAQNLTSGETPLSYSLEANVLTASAGDEPVFTLSLTDNGDYIFTLVGAIDHSEGNGENLQSINFSSIIEATDFDGDTITLNNDFFIKIVDDVPVASGESVNVTVDEDDINTGLSDGNQPNDSNGDGSFTGQPLNPFDNGPANVSGSVASLVSFGADGAGTFTLSNNFDGLLAQNLTSQGDDLTFSVDGNVLTAEAEGRDVFTLTLDTNGEFKFELHDQLDHAEANGENNLPLDLSSAIVATDADGDSITLESGFVVNVTDDVPEQDGLLPDVGIVEEEALPAGNQEINDSSYTITLPFIGTITIPLDGWPDITVATGSLADQVSVGADEPASFELSGEYTSLIAQNLTSDGEPLTYALDGNTLYAVAGQTPVFTLSLNTEGDYTFTLMGPIDHAEGDGENLLSIDFSGIVNAEDFDGDSLTLDQDFYIKIVDDVPVVGDNEHVRLDDDALDGGNPDGPGDQADAVNVNGTLSHSFGADGGSISWLTSGAPNGFSYEADGDNLLVKQDGTTVLTLTLDPATGDYTVTQNAPIDHKDNGNDRENNQIFDIEYRVEDADGDTATGSLRVNVDDDTPVIGDQLTATVDDEGLVDGIEGGPEDDLTQGADESTFSGSLSFSTGADQPGSVDFASMDGETATVGTETVTYSWSEGVLTAVITGGDRNGTELFTVEVTDATTGDYTVTLLDNVLHESLDGETGDNTENNASVDLEFTVTDNDGDSQTGHLTVDFDDDTPVVSSQQINLLTESFENFAPNLSGDNWTVVGEGGGTIIGNNGIEWTVNGAGIEIQSGNVGGASASDGDVHAELDAHDSNGDGGPTLTVLSTDVDLPTSEATLSFDFQPRPDDVDGSDMAVSLGGQTVNINVDGAGVIDFGSLPAGVSASQSSSAGGWTTITLTFTGLDTNSAQTLSFEGVGSENTLGAYIDNISLDAVASLTVDESALAEGNGETGASTTASFDFSGFFSGEFGADGPAGETSESYSLSLNGQDVASGLYTVDNSDTAADDGDGYGQGTEIVLNEVNGEIVGSAGDTDYFTISVNAETGEVTLAQLENIWHADTTNPDDSQGMVLDAELLSLVKTLTDADGDSAEATLDLGGVSFNFEDDGPAITVEQPTQPYLLTVTNEGGDAGYNNTYGFYIKGENGEPVSGEIIWANVKDNTSEEVTVEVTDPSDIGFFIIPDGADLNDINNGDGVTFQKDGEGNWEVLVGGEPLSGQGTNVLFNDPALNPDDTDAVDDNAAAGNQNWEDIIGGDNDFNDVNINVSINQLGAITVDETDIGNGDPSNATATLDLSGSFTPDFGADGEGDVDYSLSVADDAESGLVDTVSGKAVELRVNGDGDVEGYIITDDNMELVVFTASVDDSGEVTLTQLRAVEHDDVTDPDEANSPAMLNAGAIALSATITDADGDSASDSIDVGVLFAFEDDGPSVGTQSDAAVDEGETVTGQLVFDAGQDEGGISHINGVALEFGQDGYSQEIELDHGTLQVKANGEYSYSVDSGSVSKDEVENFSFTVTDGDGDTAQGAVAITIVDAQVSDVVTLNDVTVNEGDGTVTITGSVENPVTGSPLVINLDNGATITIPVGDTSAASTPFPVQGDDPYVDGETYTVEVTGTSGGNYSSLDTSDDATVTISDTIDTTTVTLDDVSVAEDGTITYSASVDNAPQGNLTITLTNGVVITIPDGATTGSSTPQAAQGDDVYVDGESFNVGIQSTSGGNYEALDSSDTATVTVTDTIDTVTATLTTSTTELSEDGGDITYTVTLSGGPGDIDPDTDLVFNLANGEQVTISAGDTSGSFTRTYTDAEITNQVSITNSIAGIASGGSEYEDLQTAGTTTVDVDYTPEISNLTPAANGGDVTVDEDDLTAGSDTSKESTTQEGTFTISSGDAIDDLTIDGHAVITDGTFSTTSFTTALGNTLSVTGYDANTGEITYTYELVDNTLGHGPADNGENDVFENFAVSLSDADGDVANDTLSVQIIDDVPAAATDNAQAEEGSSETLGADLVLMIDTSASVSSSDLSSMKLSLQNLFNSGSVHSVFITSFAEGSTFHNSGENGGWYTNLGDAMTAINALSSSGSGTFGTDYDAALEAVTENFTAPPAGGGQLVSMFISDGEPNETNGTGTEGIIGSEETSWIQFLENNGFDNSFAVGYNGLNNDDISFLEPIAWSAGEGVNDNSGSDDNNVIILDNIDDLTAALTSTVTVTPTPVTGSVLDNDNAGADGFGTPALVDVTYDGTTVTFSDTTTSATFETDAGTVVINSDGSYEFIGLADVDTDISATIDYTIQDGDGDQSSSNLVVTTQVADELYVGSNQANTYQTQGGDDVLIGDLGGRDQQYSPGSNYSIALIADESGSMEGDRLTLLKDALESFVNDLADHDGVINIGLIGFGQNANLEISVSDLANNPDGLNDLLDEISDLSASGGTNYEAAFDEAVDWFSSQPTGHEFISYFMTDGDPTYSNSGSNGSGSSTNYEDLYDAVQAFQALSAISEVNAIGIGSGVNTDYLRFFDNTNNNGTGTEVFGFDTEILANFQGNGSNDPLETGWSVNTDNNDGRITRQWGNFFTVEDRGRGQETVATSAIFMVAVPDSVLSFEYRTDYQEQGDTFSWQLQKLDGGNWSTVQNENLDFTNGFEDVSSQPLDAGQYRVVFTADNGGTGDEIDYLDIDNIELRVPDNVVTGPVGEPQVINTAGELTAQLQTGNTTEGPADLGDDLLQGGEGDDVLIGDTLFTDNLTWTNDDTGETFSAGHGLGYEGLVEYLTWAVNNGTAPDDAQIMQYIRDNYDDLINPNPTQAEIDAAGDDTLIGGGGNDILIGGEGADIFQWNQGDEGEAGSPAVDYVVDFDTSEGDVLNLADLLDSDGSKTIDDTNLDNYLKATFDAGSNQTKIDVYTNGDANSGGESTQSIFVNGNQQDLTTLLNNNNLNVDQS